MKIIIFILCKFQPELLFFTLLATVRKIDNTIPEVTIGNYANHLYYLTEEDITYICITDELISKETKLKIEKKNNIKKKTEQNINDKYENDIETHFKKLPLRKEEISLSLLSSNIEIFIIILSKMEIV